MTGTAARKTTYIYSTLAAVENPPDGTRMMDDPTIYSAEKAICA
jgi:hypothetical protein